MAFMLINYITYPLVFSSFKSALCRNSIRMSKNNKCFNHLEHFPVLCDRVRIQTFT